MKDGVSLASGAADENFDNMGRAIDHVTSLQVKVGLWQNQLDAAIQVTEDQKTNIEIQRSNLLDTDLAEATAQLARSNALLQAAQAIITKIDTDTLFQKL
jgi:flagellin-like hook-associated protein FlgL